MGNKVKYRVRIPKPKADRMPSTPKTVIIERDYGWEGGDQEYHKLDADVATFEFDVDEGMTPRSKTNETDGCTFTVRVQFSNNTATRFEEMYLEPERVI